MLALAASASLATGAVAHRTLSFPWEARWVQRATSLTFAKPGPEEQETLSGEELRRYLSNLTADNGADWGLRCILREHEGTITIDGDQYSVQFLYCKFEGDSLLVKTSWKTITLFQRGGQSAIATDRATPDR